MDLTFTDFIGFFVFTLYDFVIALFAVVDMEAAVTSAAVGCGARGHALILGDACSD